MKIFSDLAREIGPVVRGVAGVLSFPLPALAGALRLPDSVLTPALAVAVPQDDREFDGPAVRARIAEELRREVTGLSGVWWPAPQPCDPPPPDGLADFLRASGIEPGTLIRGTVINGVIVPPDQAAVAALPVRGASVHTPILWIDEALARHLETTFGRTGEEAAAGLRSKALVRAAAARLDDPDAIGWPGLIDLWSGWISLAPGPCHALGRLARAIWCARVKPDVEHSRGRVAMTPGPVIEVLARTHTKGITVAGGQVLDREGQRLAEWHAPDNIPIADIEAVGRVALAGVPALATVNAHRLLLFEILQGNAQTFDLSNRDPRAVDFDGGWQGLAEAAGVAPSQGEHPYTLAERIVCAQAFNRWHWPDGSWGNMLTFWHYPEARGRRARLRLVLGEPLLQGWRLNLSARALTYRDAKRLVAVPDRLPPVVGNPVTHGAQLALWWQVLAMLRAGVADLPDHGGIRVRPVQVERLAAAVGLSPDGMAKALDRWTQDGPDCPAMLERKGDLWHLGPTWERHRAKMLEAGRAEVNGRLAGQAASTRRGNRWSRRNSRH